MPRKTETVEPIDLNDLAGPAPEVEQENDAPSAYTKETIVTQLPGRSEPLLQQWFEFVRNLPPDAPYDLLNQLPFHQGFVYRAEEMFTSVHDQSITVTFALMVGRTMDDLRKVDTFTIQVPRNTVAPSLAARSIMMPTVVYLMFGRLPPEAPPVPAPAPVRQPEAKAAPVQQPEPQVPWQEEEDSPKELPNVVLRRTADGLPIIADLYSEAARPDDLITAAMNALADGLEGAGTQAALTALWNKNANAVEFIKDFGSDGDKTRLATMFKNRAKELRN